MAWQATFFRVLIVGGLGLMDAEKEVLGRSARDSPVSNGTGVRVHASPSADALVQKSDIRDGPNLLPGSQVRLLEAPLAKLKLSNGASEPSFKLCDPLGEYDDDCRECIRDEHMIAGGYFSGNNVYRCPFLYEENYDVYQHIKIRFHPIFPPGGNGKLIDESIVCNTYSSYYNMVYCTKSSEPISYRHQVLGIISTPVIKAQTSCSDYCIAFYTALLSHLGDGKFKWQIGSRCPEEINEECSGMDESSIIGIGDNAFCYKKHLVQGFDDYGPVLHYLYGRIFLMPPLRKCGKFTNCLMGYCLRRRNESITRCGHTSRMFHQQDPYPDCFWKTGDNASLRISEDEWCCRNPDGCGTPVVKCSESKDCYANYCIGIPNRNQNETRCPTGNNETEWEECSNLKWRETKWIKGRNAWCCIPLMDSGCDYKIRSCGSNLSCQSSYCIAEKEAGSFYTFCPENGTKNERCENLSEGQELFVLPERVCCKKSECFANGTICGDRPTCDTNYCVGSRAEGSTKVSTACPTNKEDRLIGSVCSVLSPGENVMVAEREVWCCKRRYCSMGNMSQDHFLPVTETFSESSSLWPTTVEILYLTFIAAIILIFVSCSVAIVCCQVLMFERKRAKKFAKNRKGAKEQPVSRYQGKLETFLEKLLYGKGEEGREVAVQKKKPKEPEATNEFSAALDGPKNGITGVRQLNEISQKILSRHSSTYRERESQASCSRIASQKPETAESMIRTVFENYSEDSREDKTQLS